MEITPQGQTIRSNETPAQHNRKTGQTDNQGQANQVNISQAESSKTQLNQSILKASLEVSIKSGNDSMTLLYRSAIDKLNEVLETDLGESSINKAYDSGLDVSPEATAERIATQTTGFFASYRQQNPELSESEAAEKFSEIIRGGIKQGFDEAREILDGLKVLEGDIATNIDTTYGLVQEKLDSFFANLAKTEPAETPSS
ncbi:DUF5610 domain-containing protein [Aliamphritea ceti]|uniref:DUF5610 domain-containing protein n=1 Tax=Aliamphritea ceti TaxID=1524258 RepID=UPI0021C450AD|nr:DUF5610 domain-containing protein [Aliamphritea ceti]